MGISPVEGIQIFAKIPENCDAEWFLGSININLNGRDFFIQAILNVKDYEKVISFSKKEKTDANNEVPDKW